jgi:hypothetical protein
MVNTPWVKSLLCFMYMHKYLLLLLLLWPMLFFYRPLNTFSWFHCEFACIDIRLNIFADLHLFKHTHYHTISFTSFYQFMCIQEIKCAWFKCVLRHKALSWLLWHVLQKLESCPTHFDIFSMFYHSYMWCSHFCNNQALFLWPQHHLLCRIPCQSLKQTIRLTSTFTFDTFNSIFMVSWIFMNSMSKMSHG